MIDDEDRFKEWLVNTVRCLFSKLKLTEVKRVSEPERKQLKAFVAKKKSGSAMMSIIDGVESARANRPIGNRSSSSPELASLSEQSLIRRVRSVCLKTLRLILIYAQNSHSKKREIVIIGAGWAGCFTFSYLTQEVRFVCEKHGVTLIR